MNNKFLADVRSMSNYYPYGMEIKAGSWSGGSYNYGYNGMLKEGIGKDIYNTHFRNLSGEDSRWWSHDPLEAKFPDESPFLTMGWNPIRFIDVYGDETTLHGDKDNSYRIVDKLNKISDAVHFNLDDNNNMQYDCIIPFAFTNSDKTLMDAIDDKGINNHIIVTENNFGINVEGKAEPIASGGLFGGSFKGKDNKIHGIQYYNPNTANMISKFFNEYIKNGELETHEGMEVYIGAKIFQNSTKILSVEELFEKSHGATLILFNSESLETELQYTVDMQYRYPIVYLLKNPNINIVPFTFPVKGKVNVTDYKEYNIE